MAVSRARRTLVVIGHPDLDARRSPTLASLREHMLAVRKAEGQSGATSAPVRTDSDAERLVLEAMRRRGLAPLGKITVEGFELDFAVMDGEARLNVEIDGGHHLDARRRQRRNDLARDAVLAGLGWRVLRVPAWRCHAEAETVAAEIVSALERLH